MFHVPGSLQKGTGCVCGCLVALCSLHNQTAFQLCACVVFLLAPSFTFAVFVLSVVPLVIFVWFWLDWLLAFPVRLQLKAIN